MVLIRKGVTSTLLWQLQLPLNAPPLSTLGLMGRMKRKLGEKQWAMLCRLGNIIFHFLCYWASHAFYKYL